MPAGFIEIQSRFSQCYLHVLLEPLIFPFSSKLGSSLMKSCVQAPKSAGGILHQLLDLVDFDGILRDFVYHVASTTGSTFEHPTQRGVQPEGLATEAKLGPCWAMLGHFPIGSFSLETNNASWTLQAT